jgi:hypothetical protein
MKIRRTLDLRHDGVADFAHDVKDRWISPGAKAAGAFRWGCDVAFSMSVTGTLAEVLAPLGRLANGAAVQAGCYALNHTIAKAKTQVARALGPQTGLPYGSVSKEIKQFSASPGKPQASLEASGAYHRLSEFAARKTGSGISAAPWGVRRIFPGTFFIAPYSGGVFRRKGSKRFPVTQLWGPAIPKEMVKGPALSAWDRTLTTELPARMAHEWRRLIAA